MTEGNPTDAERPETDLAEVILAEVSGRAWLVRGEEHIDNLLNNTLDPAISIQVIACESKMAVDALWARWSDEDPQAMWMIHPGILGRVKGNPAGSTLRFPPWSAAFDKDAQKVIELAVTATLARPEATLALVRNVAEGVDAMADEMAGLRCTLIERRLVQGGLDPARMVRESRPATVPEDADLYALLLR